MTMRVSLSDKINLNLMILADDRLSATAKTVAGWLLLYHHNTETGVCNPSNRTIGIAIGIRPENVSRHIRSLVKYGYLIARRRFGTSNSYDFNWSKGSKAEVRALRTRLKRACATQRDMTESTIPVDGIVNTCCSKRQDDDDENVNLILEEKTRIEDGNLTLPGEIDIPLSYHLDEVSKKGDLELRHDQVDRLMARFRSTYPLVISDSQVPAVRATLSRALTVAEADAILDGAMRYATECTGREAKFIADPVNWLNGRRWSSGGKVKSEVAILGADGIPLPNDQPRSRRQQIAQWKPSRKNPFSLQ